MAKNISTFNPAEFQQEENTQSQGEAEVEDSEFPLCGNRNRD
jgi:hypothetical protein